MAYNLSVMFVYVVTLVKSFTIIKVSVLINLEALYPAVTAAVHSVNPPSYSPLSNPLLFNAVHFLIFNAGDWIGRLICSFSPFQVWSRRRIALLSFSRVVFVPLFLACNVDGGAKSDSGGSSPFINSDFIFFSILLLFGITNGHLTSVSMMAAASLEHNKRLRKEQVDTAAVIAQFSLAAGLVLGSIANFGILARICNCNPFLH
jgi:equilibrative nucleoside transporter 1/2/3